MSFLKTGQAVHEEIEKADLQQAAAFGPRRYWVDNGKEARITFLDGVVEGGLLQAVSFYEHMLPRAGKKGFDNYPCTQETEPCPICEDGNTPSLVFAMTILDHRPWKDQQGKTHQHERKLFVCKRQTFKMLQMKMSKDGVLKDKFAGIDGAPAGLVGVTFDVTRTGDKSASVGSDFDFVEKNALSDVFTTCGITKPEDMGPFVYDETIKYFPAAELRKMGLGMQNGVGSAAAKHVANENAKAADSPPPPGGKNLSSTFNPSKEL